MLKSGVVGQEGIGHIRTQFLLCTGDEGKTAKYFVGLGDIFGRRAEEGRGGNQILDFILEDQLVGPGSDAVHITLKIIGDQLNVVLLVPDFDTAAIIDYFGG